MSNLPLKTKIIVDAASKRARPLPERSQSLDEAIAEMEDASLGELNEAVSSLIPILDAEDPYCGGTAAMAIGAAIEYGAEPAPACKPLRQALGRMMSMAAEFAGTWDQGQPPATNEEVIEGRSATIGDQIVDPRSLQSWAERDPLNARVWSRLDDWFLPVMALARFGERCRAEIRNDDRLNVAYLKLKRSDPNMFSWTEFANSDAGFHLEQLLTKNEMIGFADELDGEPPKAGELAEVQHEVSTETDYCQETFERMCEPEYRIFTNKMITWATFLGSAVAGGVLMAHNFWRWREPRAARNCLIFCAVVTVLLLIVGYHLPEDLDLPSSAFTIPQMFLVSWAVHVYQGRRISEHIGAGGKKGAFLIATGVSIVVAAVIFGMILGYEALYYKQFGSIESFFYGDEVYYKDGATAQDAEALADVLEQVGWFGDSLTTAVQITRPMDHYIISILVADDAWDDDDFDEYFGRIADRLAEEGFGRDLELRLCDVEFHAIATVRPEKGCH
jgi:hypothetical protein